MVIRFNIKKSFLKKLSILMIDVSYLWFFLICENNMWPVYIVEKIISSAMATKERKQARPDLMTNVYC